MEAMDTQQPAVSRDFTSVRPPRRRRRIWIVLLLGLAGAAWLGRFTYLRITLKPTPRTEYWSAQLASLDPAPAGGLTQLQIEDLLTAFDYLTADPAVIALPQFDITSDLNGVWRGDRPDIQLSIKLMETPKFSEAREEIRRGVRAGWQEQQKVGPNVVLASLAQYREIGKWLVSHSRYAHEELHDPRIVEDDWLLALGIARQARRQQLIISWLVVAAIQDLVMEEILLQSREGMAHPQVRRFIDQVDQLRAPRLTTRMILEGVRIYAHSLLDACYISEGGDWLDVSSFVATQFAGGSGKASAPLRIWNLTSPLFHNYETAVHNVDAYVEQYSGLQTMSDLFKSQATRLQQPDSLPVSILDGVDQVGDLSRYCFLIYRGELLVEAALASLAINEFHLSHHQYPESLAQLVPEFLSRIPIDFADNQPLRYRKTSNGYLLYSLGADGIDDDGKVLQGRQYLDEANPDIVFNNIARGEYTP